VHMVRKKCVASWVGIPPHPPPVQGTVCRPIAVRKSDTSAFKEPESSYLRGDDKSQLLEPVLS
jgi:hypothetical protein